MFQSARIRLTAWYVAALAVFLVVLGTAVYAAVRSQLYKNVDRDVQGVADRARDDLLHRDAGDLSRLRDGVRYHVSVTFVGANEPFQSPRASALGLPDSTGLMAAMENRTDIRTISSPEGRLRLYSQRVQDGGAIAVVQVARSLEPETQALGRVLAVLLVGGAASLVLAAAGGWFLAGKSLAPVHEAFERQRAFVADASHELRTPLAVIRANAEYLHQHGSGGEEVEEIVNETERLTTLVDALLTLARGDLGAEAGEREPLDLAQVVASSARAMQPLAENRGIALAVETNGGVQVEGNRDRLRQLVVILVDNALRYTDRGGRVEVGVERENGSAVLAVRDTGVGIPQDVLPHVFERFYRADEARTRESGGAGLGLSIARQLADEHGGTIEAESTPGQGSTFTVRLPAKV